MKTIITFIKKLKNKNNIVENYGGDLVFSDSCGEEISHLLITLGFKVCEKMNNEDVLQLIVVHPERKESWYEKWTEEYAPLFETERTPEYSSMEGVLVEKVPPLWRRE